MTRAETGSVKVLNTRKLQAPQKENKKKEENLKIEIKQNNELRIFS